MPTFRAGTKLVQVNVVAQDQHGKPVADLHREDFQIFDNGAPQEIRLFVAETPGPGPTVPVVKAPNTFTNIQQPGSRGGYSVILVDNLVSGFGDPLTGEEGSGFGVQKVLRMLHMIPPSEKIAIYTFGRKLRVVAEFTSDRDSLERQLRAWKPSVDVAAIANDLCGGGDPSDPANSSKLVALAAPEVPIANARARSSCFAGDLQGRVSAMDTELQQIAEHLNGVPGRKRLIWMANRFPIINSPGVQRLNNAGIAIYPIDENGVLAPSPDIPKMRALAALTGGMAFFQRNDLDIAIGEAIEDGRVSYTLGYYPPSQDKRVPIHRLMVKVNRPGVTLRYRFSYSDEAPAKSSVSPVTDLVKALNRPSDAITIPLAASVKRMGDQLTLSLTVDAPSLDLELNRGLWKGKVELVAKFVSWDGAPVGEVLSQTVTFNLRPTTYSAVLQSGLPMLKQVRIPAKADELKLLVGNLASGKVGTLSIPLAEIVGGTTSIPSKKRKR